MDWIAWAGVLISLILAVTSLVKSFRISAPEKAEAMATLQEMLSKSMRQIKELSVEMDRVKDELELQKDKNLKLESEMERLRTCYDDLIEGTKLLIAQLEINKIEPAWRPKSD